VGALPLVIELVPTYDGVDTLGHVASCRDVWKKSKKSRNLTREYIAYKKYIAITKKWLLPHQQRSDAAPKKAI